MVLAILIITTQIYMLYVLSFVNNCFIIIIMISSYL